MFNEVEYTPEATTFNLNAPSSASLVMVHIYASAESTLSEQNVKMRTAGIDRWTATVCGDLKGKFYTFDVGHGESPGTFAKAVAANGHRGAIIDMSETNPEGWDEDIRPAIKSPSDLIIYELHHRDFSIHPSSHTVHAGKYLALTEQHNIFYLKTLGITAVQLQPSFDFATVDELHPEHKEYNWGYDPLNYNVPEGSYSTDAAVPEVRIREFKQMVMALHRAGIRVILDVVYNHCYSVDESNFQRTYPDYYFRRRPDGRLSNGSGCGNETASEKSLMRQFIIESTAYWAMEYHIDGFRFDLMGIHDIETMNAVRHSLNVIDPSLTVHGEGWSADQCAIDNKRLALKSSVFRMPGIGAFGDEMRNAVITSGASCWLAGKNGNTEAIKFGIAGAIRHPQIDIRKVRYSDIAWALQPWQHVAYVSCHDDLCLLDMLRQTFPDASEQELISLDKLAQTPVLLSQGMAFLYGGEELMRTKRGVRNTYRSPDDINVIQWDNLHRYPDLFLYYQGLISLRREHPAFRMGTAEMVRRHLNFLPTKGNLVAFSLNGKAVGDTWHRIVVVMNPDDKSRKTNIPTGNYVVVCKDGCINPHGISHTHGGRITVGPRQVQICVIMP